MATVSGDIDLMTVGELVLWIAHRSHTGTLVVKRRNASTTFVLRQGQLWQTTATDPREFLGQHLINFGYITEDQLQHAFETQQETHVPLGRILVLVDAVSQEQLDRVLLFKTRESLLEALSWTEGSFRFLNDDTSDPELDTAQPVNLLEVHSESQARASMWREIRNIFPNDATRVDVVGDTSRLSGFDRKLVELMVAGHSLGEASLELHAMDFQTYARLYDLFNRGIVRPRLTASSVATSPSRPVPAIPTLPTAMGAALPQAPVPQAAMPQAAVPQAAHAAPVGLPATNAPASASSASLSAALMAAALIPAPPASAKSATSGTVAAHQGPSPSAGPYPPGALEQPRPTASPEWVPPATLAPPRDAWEERGPAGAPRTGSSINAMRDPHASSGVFGAAHTATQEDPHTAMRLALAGRDWSEAFLIAQRILERDPIDAEAIAAWRVANAQLVKHRAEDDSVDMRVIPHLAIAREMVAMAHLTSKERYVLSRIDGRRSLQQIAAVSPIQKAELLRIVNSFVSRGVLKFGP